ncbi:MAG: lysoplasmalogenase [Promethearchaeota archaeon]
MEKEKGDTMLIGIVFLICFLLAGSTHLYGEWAILHDQPNGIKIRYISKPFLMIFLGLYYVFTALPGYWNIWLLLGILGGLGGDVCLMIPDPAKTKKAFKIGLISFLVGHIFYIVAFIQAAGNFQGFIWWSLIFSLPYVVYGFILHPRITRSTGPMTIPVTVYIIVIIIMGISTGLLWGIRSTGGILVAMIGAWIFIISDTFNAFNKFSKPIPNERLYTMSTYILGQFLLILGFLLL